MLNILIIGYGSIGKRHARILRKIKQVNLYIYSKRKLKIKNILKNINKIIEIEFDFIIISNETSEHHLTLKKIINLNFNGKILIEKPVFNKFMEIDEFYKKKILVAYNFRFNKLLQDFRNKLLKEKIISVNIYAGQYLPNWRPYIDYKSSYSASRSKGGGVLLDLSHEIDYLQWIFGKVKKVFASGGKYSNLKINTEDVYQIKLETEKCNLVFLELNYLDKPGKRIISCNTNKHSYTLNLLKNTINIDGQTKKYFFKKNHSYENMLNSLINNNPKNFCKFNEANEILKIIGSIKKSNKNNQLVKVS